MAVVVRPTRAPTMVVPPARVVCKVLPPPQTTVDTVLAPVLRARVVATHRVAGAPVLRTTAVPPVLRRTPPPLAVRPTGPPAARPPVAVVRGMVVAAVAAAPVVVAVGQVTLQVRQLRTRQLARLPSHCRRSRRRTGQQFHRPRRMATGRQRLRGRHRRRALAFRP